MTKVVMRSVVRGHCTPPSFCSLSSTPSRSSSSLSPPMSLPSARPRMISAMMSRTLRLQRSVSRIAPLSQRASVDDGYKSARLKPPASFPDVSSSCRNSSRRGQRLPTADRTTMSVTMRDIRSPISTTAPPPPRAQSSATERSKAEASSSRM